MTNTCSPTTDADVDRIRDGLKGHIEPATKAECRELIDFLRYHWGCAPEELPGAYIGTIRSYITDGPGFIGEVYVIVWAGSPSFVTVVTKAADGTFEIVANQGA